MLHTVKEVCLDNGARGLIINVPAATVMSFHFNFRAGNYYVKTPEIYETAHLMEHMSFGANSLFRDEHEYEAEFARNGAYHNAYTGDYSMGYTAECADFEWDRILELQGLAIAEPNFNETELSSEKGNVLSELNGCVNQYNRLLWPKVQQALGERVLLYPERIKTIANITLADIREHHTRTHTSDNMRFIIAGKFEGNREERLIDIIEKWRLARGEFFVIPRDTYRKARPALIRRKDASNLTFGWSSIINRHLDDAEDDAMDCLNHILTGTMYSKIFGAARKRGLLYDMFSDVNNGPYDCAWDFGGEVNYDVADELFDIIVSELRKVLDGKISDDDMTRAKQYALGRHQMGAQTAAQIGHYYARYFNLGIIDDYAKAPELIQRTSKEDIIRVAREFMVSNIWMLAAVGSCRQSELVKLSSKLATLYSK